MASSSSCSMSCYKYNISLQYRGGTKDRDVKTQSIRNIVIDYNYDECVMPTIMANLRLEKKFVDDLIKNQNNAYFILTISGHDTTATFSSNQTAINVKCTYFIPDELNKLDEVEYSQADDEDNGGQSYTQATLGLLVVDHINNNKVQSAITVRDITPQDLIKSLTQHMKNMVIEDIAFNDKYTSIIIPPNMSDSVNKALQYLNNQRVFYNTPYRFFQNFNETILISSSGNGIPSPVPDMSGNNNTSIIITVSEIDDMTTVISGIINQTITALLSSIGLESLSGLATSCFSGNSLGSGNTGGQSAQVGVNYANLQVFDNTISNKSKNKIKGMTEVGINEAELSNKSELVKSSYRSSRINNNNTNMMANIAFKENASKYYIYFNKTDLDCTLFNPLKSITINNTNKYQELNGKYLLYNKKESYLRDSNDFILTTHVFLQRISDNSNGSDSYSGNSQTGSGSFFQM